MFYSTTISSKGQVVIPKKIRDKLGLKSGHTLGVALTGKKIVVEPFVSPEEVFGMFGTKKPINKQAIKQSFKKQVKQKHHLP
jgi:AbrB family looped-hinge helix DNA binding protein